VPQAAPFDLARLPIAPPVQCKPTVSKPGDQHEREADAVADLVMRRMAGDSAEPVPHIQRQGVSGAPDGDSRKQESGEQRDVVGRGARGQASSAAGVPAAGIGGSFGLPLDARVQKEMGRHLGHDFGNVRVYTDDPAALTSQRLNARAFTTGSNIFFARSQYEPHTARGQRLIAHELTHVVQQGRREGSGEPGALLLRTGVGEVLDSFFSPFSTERLWVMGPTDPYTAIVRGWQPVREEMARARVSIETKCSTWASDHTSSAGFTPTMTDPPVWDPRSYVRAVRSPPGTDPDTCKAHFIPYVLSKGAAWLARTPPIETRTLSTCAIGSFAIGITVDTIDCAAKTATLNVWMFNAMDRGSFGRYASHPAFRLSRMERQYMWWHWTESHAWGQAATAIGGGSSAESRQW
jgi:hypothetical protein